MKINFSSYKLKISITIVLLIALISAVSSVMGVMSIRGVAIKVMADNSSALLNQALQLIDVAKLKTLIKTEDASDEYYIETCAKMNQMRIQTNAKYLYVMAPVSGTNFKYVLDGSDFDDEENYSPIGTEEDIASYGKWPFTCLNEKKIVSGDFSNQDDWGWATTTYAPIIDERGQAFAFMAVDYEVESIINIMRDKSIKLFAASIINMLLSLIIILIFIHRIFSKMREVGNAMNSIAAGKSDLTHKIPVEHDSEIDRLAQACNNVTGYLQNIIRNIKHSMSTLSVNSNEMSSQNQNILKSMKTMLDVNAKISEKAAIQSDLTKETQTNLKDMMNRVHALDSNVDSQSSAMSKSSSAVEEISANINTANQLIQVISGEYKEIVEKTINEQKKQQKITDEILKIVEQAQSLNEANNMITEISQRTNLLAMNAAIEASHAGKFGVGFSVVASEIRRLAETSANHTKTIGTTVSDIEKSIAEMQKDSIEMVNSFGQLGASISTMEKHLDEIKCGMDEQAVGAREILEVMRVLKDCADNVKDTADEMKKECTLVTDKMNQLSTHSNDVTQHTKYSVEILDEVQKLTQTASKQAETNKELSNEVSAMLANYNV